jgi:hypothetical protein
MIKGLLFDLTIVILLLCGVTMQKKVIINLAAIAAAITLLLMR